MDAKVEWENLQMKKPIYQYEGMQMYEDMVMIQLGGKEATDGARNFPYDTSDILISTYPRSGRFN